MISAIITSFKEEKTIGKAIEQIAKQISKEDEILVVAPDRETLEEAKKYALVDKRIRVIKDKGEGKPTALNLAVSKAKGDILILTDGDVYLDDRAIDSLMKKFNDKKIGAVSGRPISTNPKNEMFGYWAYLLTEIANERRAYAYKNGKRFFCSGYLFAIKKELFPKLPVDLLSEDGYISHKVYEKGFKIAYSEEARVYVKYPSNFRDWIKQKKRSAGGYNQIKKILGVEIRSFKKESLGAFGLLKYVSGFKELFWIVLLFLARIYLWVLIYIDINLKRKKQSEIWERVESTK